MLDWIPMPLRSTQIVVSQGSVIVKQTVPLYARSAVGVNATSTVNASFGARSRGSVGVVIVYSGADPAPVVTDTTRARTSFGVVLSKAIDTVPVRVTPTFE